MNNAPNQVPRFSNIEASRILAMFLIVAHHFAVHGGVPIWKGDFPMSGNYYFTQLFSTGGKIGVDLFVLITGYFICNKISKLSSLVYLWISTFFYVFLFYLVFTVVGIKEFTWSGLISCFFPIRNDFYWFISAYFVLILASPFLTLTIRSLGGKKLLALILVFGLIWSVIPTITTRTEYYGSSLLWFIYLFFVGAYLRTKLERYRFSTLKAVLLATVPWLCVAGLIWIADMSNRSSWNIGFVDWFTFANMTSIFTLLSSLGLFILFKQWRLGYFPWINKVAAAMLGVYLIHENPTLYPWLWKTVFNINEHLNEPYFIPYALGVTTVVFTIFTLIEMVREKYMRKWFKRVLMPKLAPIDSKIQRFFDSPN